MRKIVTPLVSLIILFTFSQCGKKATSVDEDFAGNWYGYDYGYDYTISISDNSHGEYMKTNGMTTVTASGVARIKNDKLHIGLIAKSIDEYPSEDSSGVATMVIDGVEMVRQF